MNENNKKLDYNWYLILIRGARGKKSIEKINQKLEERSEFKELIKDLRSSEALKNYIFCYCRVTKELINFLRGVDSINGFLRENKDEFPRPISPSYVESFLEESGKKEKKEKVELEENIERDEEKEKKEEININIKVNDRVKIIVGNFKDFEGTVTHIDSERGKVKVVLSRLNWEITDLPLEYCIKK